MSSCRLYLVSPPRLSPASFAVPLREALEGGDVACFQLRMKGADDDTIRRATDLLKPIVQANGAAFLLNDRPDLAAELGCDGVHIGQEDLPYAEARATVGRDRIVGVTCHNSRHLAMVAAEEGADYVAFGAFFASKTKEPPTMADIDILSWWSELMEVPCVAIGGITVENAPKLVAAGADFLAVSAGVWDYSRGPQAAVKAFNNLF